MPQPEMPAARSRAIQGSAYSESASNGASMPTPARSLYPKLAFFISLLMPPDEPKDFGPTDASNIFRVSNAR